MACPAHLVPTARSISCGQLVVAAAAAQDGPQVELPRLEQARAELALGGEAHPVAVAAERLRDAGDDADVALPVGVEPPIGGRRSPTAGRHERVDGIDGGHDLVLAHDLGPVPRAGGVEGHELDEAHADAGVAPQVGDVDDLVVVHAPLDDAVDLHRVEARLLRGVDAVEHPLQVVAAGDGEEALAAERVERDVDAVEAGVAQLVGQQAEGGAVGGDREVGLLPGQRRVGRRGQPQAGQLRHEHRQVGPHGRLAAGEADAVDVEALHEDPGQALDLLEGEQVLPGQPRHALGRHAVRAAEVAPVGDRDPQVADGTAEGVDQVVGIPVHRTRLVADAPESAARTPPSAI